MAEEVFDQREVVDILLRGITRANAAGDGSPIVLLCRDDGTLRTWSSMIGLAANGETQVKVENTGELDVVGHGKDAAGNIDAFRTNDNKQQQIEIVTDLTHLDPVLVPSAEGVLLDGSVSLVSGGAYEVHFNVVNIDGTNDVTVDIGIDKDAGGGLSGAEYYMKDVLVPAGGQTGVHRIRMGGDDDIRGVAGAANDAAIHFVEVKRVL